MDTFEKKYPQAAKVQEVRERSQTCGEFMDWLQSEKGLVLAKWHLRHEHDDNCTSSEGFHTCGLRIGQDDLRMDHAPIYDLLAEFFGIDLKAYENEKRQMLEELRAQRGKRWLNGEEKES